MCGICGFFWQGQVESPLPLAAMNDSMAHRGPDDAGTWVSSNGRVGLANRRLAIRDLSPAGHQPMSNEDGSVWIVYNGEIYDFDRLRNELLAKGHQFRSRSDTEILIHLYEEYGDDMVQLLRGMFAFAIWDENRRRLFIARDRVGIKPLYYAQLHNAFLFGSEIKAMLASGLPALRPQLHSMALLQFMAMGFVSPPDTLFAGIRKLPPGHRMVLDNRGLHITRYWDVFQNVEPVEELSETEYVDHTLELLEESVRIRLVADVPVGVFLSGGIDSSLVAALAARNSSHPVQSFTLGFRGHPDYNEVVHARRVADYLKADAHEVMIGPEEIRGFFPSFLQFLEEPVMNPIWFAIYFVSKLARDNGVIVVLSGDGGDELYAGYNRWMEYLRLYEGRAYQVLRSVPAPLRSLAGGVGQAFLRKENQREIVRRAAAGHELFWGGTTFKTSQLATMLRSDVFGVGDLWSRLPLPQLQHDFRDSLGNNPSTPLAWMSYAAMKGNLLEDYLMRLDKMGMAASIEGRVPLLDHEFIRWSQSIPAAHKYPGYRNKHLLRQVAYRLLPRELIDRPKMGFCAPVESWLADAFGTELSDSLRLLQEREQVFNPSWFNKFSERAARPGGVAFADAHWSLLMLGQWYKQWISA